MTNKEYVASLSYGKDSLYMLEIIKKNNLPLDRIIHAEIMATKDIPADLPDMVEFKKKADRFIKERYGLEVEHLRNGRTYEDYFYSKFQRGKNKGKMYGFPYRMGAWCNSRLKLSVLNKFNKPHIVQYIGLAVEETRRHKVLTTNKQSPLVQYGITEEDCYNWCKENNMLAPNYKRSSRGGCWMCHNQNLKELRYLKENHPKLWEKLLEWDRVSPVPFKANGQSVKDLEKLIEEVFIND